MKKELKEGTKVVVRIDEDIEVSGTICGIVTKHIWYTYIVKLDNPIPNSDYDYSCIGVLEFMIREAG